MGLAGTRRGWSLSLTLPLRPALCAAVTGAGRIPGLPDWLWGQGSLGRLEPWGGQEVLGSPSLALGPEGVGPAHNTQPCSLGLVRGLSSQGLCVPCCAGGRRVSSSVAGAESQLG